MIRSPSFLSPSCFFDDVGVNLECFDAKTIVFSSSKVSKVGWSLLLRWYIPYVEKHVPRAHALTALLSCGEINSAKVLPSYFVFDDDGEEGKGRLQALVPLAFNVYDARRVVLVVFGSP